MFISIVSESVTLQWERTLKFLTDSKISSTVSNHGVMACLSVFHAQNILHRDRSISLYMCTGGKELNGLACPPSFPKSLQKKRAYILASVSRMIYTAREWQELPSCCWAKVFQKQRTGVVPNARLLDSPQTPCIVCQYRAAAGTPKRSGAE